MIVYNYHPDTGVFLNTSSEADEDPMDPGKWLIPAHSTVLSPPSPPDPKKQQAVFNGSSWTVEAIPLPPAIHANLKDWPVDDLMTEPRMWTRISIKEALKGGVT